MLSDSIPEFFYVRERSVRVSSVSVEGDPFGTCLCSRDTTTMFHARFTISAVMISFFAATITAHPIAALSDAPTCTKTASANGQALDDSRFCIHKLECCDQAAVDTELVPGHADVSMIQRVWGFLLQASS